MTREQKKEILFGKDIKEKDLSITLMGHWNNDSGCMPTKTRKQKKK